MIDWSQNQGLIKISAQNCNLGQTINLIEVKIKVISKSDLGQDLVGIDFDHSNLLDHQNTLETLKKKLQYHYNKN